SSVVRVFQGVLPMVALYLTKLLIDAVTEGIKTSSAEASPTHMITILAGLAGVAVALAILNAVGGLLQKIQGQVVTDHMHAVIQAKSVEVDLEYYENARYQDTFHRAQQEAPLRPREILNNLLSLGQDLISLVAMAAILWWLHWAVIPVLVLTALPYLFVRLYNSNRLFLWALERTPLERKAWYVNTLLTEVTAAKEIRLFDLGPRLRQWFLDTRSVLRRERIALERRWTLAALAAQIIGVAGVFGIISFVAFRSFQGLLTVGDLVMFFGAVQRATA